MVIVWMNQAPSPILWIIIYQHLSLDETLRTADSNGCWVRSSLALHYGGIGFSLVVSHKHLYWSLLCCLIWIRYCKDCILLICWGFLLFLFGFNIYEPHSDLKCRTTSFTETNTDIENILRQEWSKVFQLRTCNLKQDSFTLHFLFHFLISWCFCVGVTVLWVTWDT